MIQVSFPSRGAAPQPCLTLCFLEALLHEKKKKIVRRKINLRCY